VVVLVEGVTVLESRVVVGFKSGWEIEIGK
jgi:hypothetical protein